MPRYEKDSDRANVMAGKKAKAEQSLTAHHDQYRNYLKESALNDATRVATSPSVMNKKLRLKPSEPDKPDNLMDVNARFKLPFPSR